MAGGCFFFAGMRLLVWVVLRLAMLMMWVDGPV